MYIRLHWLFHSVTNYSKHDTCISNLKCLHFLNIYIYISKCEYIHYNHRWSTFKHFYFFSHSNEQNGHGVAHTILDSYLRTTGWLQFRRKCQLHYVVSHLPTCGNSFNVQPFASSWQTAYKIHWSAMSNCQKSSAVYFD
jgi:hypothetical protein